MLEHDCCFCGEFSGPCDSGHRIVTLTPNAVAFVDIAPIVTGHLLVAPRGHYHSFAELPQPVLSEALEIRGSLMSTLKARYEHVLQFEHGSSDGRGGGCGIHHAHLHLVPVPSDFSIADRIQDFPQRRVAFEDLRSHVSAGQPYLFMQTAETGLVMFPTRLPSQYMRKLIVEALGAVDWDWRKQQRGRLFDETVALFAQ